MAKVHLIDVPTLFKLWFSDKRNAEVAEALGVGRARLWEISKKYGLPSRKHERGGPNPEDPTEAQIQERAAEVRSRWTPEMYEQRRVVKTKSWRPPAISLD